MAVTGEAAESLTDNDRALVVEAMDGLFDSSDELDVLIAGVRKASSLIEARATGDAFRGDRADFLQSG